MYTHTHTYTLCDEVEQRVVEGLPKDIHAPTWTWASVQPIYRARVIKTLGGTHK